MIHEHQNGSNEIIVQMKKNSSNEHKNSSNEIVKWKKYIVQMKKNEIN